MRMTVPRWPLETQAPSGPTATSTASAPIAIRRPTEPGTSGLSRVTLSSPALAVHTEPAPTATRSGAEPVSCRTGGVLWPGGVDRHDAVVAAARDPNGVTFDGHVGRQPSDAQRARVVAAAALERQHDQRGPDEHREQERDRGHAQRPRRAPGRRHGSRCGGRAHFESRLCVPGSRVAGTGRLMTASTGR